jgi:hypothetical protein
MTGTESIQTVISSPVSENSGAKAEVVAPVEEEVVAEAPVAAKPTLSAKEVAAELEFLNAQLSSAAVMLETLSFIEERTTRSE